MTSQLSRIRNLCPVPLSPTPGLTDQLTSALLAEITRGHLKPGDRLPTEHELATHFGVSRTVVREAIGRLKTDGLVVSRQGSGMYVASNAPVVPFRIDRNVLSILELVELRLGFDTEAAAFAAARRTDDDLQVMSRALEDMAAAIEQGEDGVDADMAFHRAICTATRNAYFETFFQFLEQYLRESLVTSRKNSAGRAGFPGRAQAEHHAIFDAIVALDSERARRAAREHVRNTAERLAVSPDEL